tara:strand:- start:46 stop:471 length:426 start_codon:yes stop_codon:yes gene_type:complete
MDEELKKSLENLSENSKNVTELLTIGNNYIDNIENKNIESKIKIRRSKRILNRISRTFSKYWPTENEEKVEGKNKEKVENKKKESNETCHDYLDDIYNESIKHQELIKNGNERLDSSIIILENNKDEMEKNIIKMKKILNK